jgi:arylsulfatase A-like enzyme
MAARATGAVRGLASGAIAGCVWIVVEAALAWWGGSVVPLPVARDLAALDLGTAMLVGLLAGVLAPTATWRSRALVLVGAYGLLRVFALPGLGSEATYLVVFAVVALIVNRSDSGGRLEFVQLVALGALGVLLGDIMLDERHASALRGLRLPFLVVAFAFEPIAFDEVLAFAVRRVGPRVAMEIAAGLVALVVTARPLSTAPLIEDLVTAVPPPAGTPDVILVSLDTTRADHLSTYGYTKHPTSPVLTALASDALLFTQARSPAGWTLPGHASMMTGLYPSKHGAQLSGTWQPGESIDGRRNVAYPLAEDRVTLAEALRDRGYQTAGFVSNFSYLYRDYGLAQGFGRYEDAPGLLLRVHPPVVRLARAFEPGFCLKPYRHATDINAAALAWLDQAPKDRPVFVFLNYMEAHQPWMAEPPFDQWAWTQRNASALAQRDLYTHEIRKWSTEELGFITASYDGQVAAMDSAIGQLVQALKARGRYENTLLIVTADHGEMLGEHGSVGHMGRMLYEPLVHIPMIIKFPGASHLRGSDDTPVQLVDLVPTVLDVAGAPPVAGVEGEILPHVTHPIRAEEGINPFLVANYGDVYDRAIRVLYDPPYKLIATSRGDHMLFDLAHDPGEEENLAAREPDRAAELARRMEAAFGTTVATAAALKQVN